MSIDPHPRLPALTLVAALCGAGAWAAAPLGPTYESLQEQPELTRFLWWGHIEEPASPETVPAAFLFVATDSSWLLVEAGGVISGVGPESWYDTPPPLADPPPPLPQEEFARAVRRNAPFAGLCDRYEVLRATLERYWHARRIWRGRVAMEDALFVDLFSAADGRWAYVVHSPQIDDPEQQACIPLRGFHSRLFEQQHPPDPSP